MTMPHPSSESLDALPPGRLVERQDSFLVRGPLRLELDRRVERSA
jgi:hypothetical protein